MNVYDPIGKSVGSGGPKYPHESSHNQSIDLVGGGHFENSVGKDRPAAFKGNQLRGNLSLPRSILGAALDVGDDDHRVVNARLEKSLQVRAGTAGQHRVAISPHSGCDAS